MWRWCVEPCAGMHAPREDHMLTPVGLPIFRAGAAGSSMSCLGAKSSSSNRWLMLRMARQIAKPVKFSAADWKSARQSLVGRWSVGDGAICVRSGSAGLCIFDDEDRKVGTLLLKRVDGAWRVYPMCDGSRKLGENHGVASVDGLSVKFATGEDWTRAADYPEDWETMSMNERQKWLRSFGTGRLEQPEQKRVGNDDSQDRTGGKLADASREHRNAHRPLHPTSFRAIFRSRRGGRGVVGARGFVTDRSRERARWRGKIMEAPLRR